MAAPALPFPALNPLPVERSPRNSVSQCRSPSGACGKPIASCLRSSLKPSTDSFFKPRMVGKIAATKPAFVLVSPVSQLPSLAEVEARVVKTEQGISEFPSTSGVYAVYDESGVLQYVGLSRKISASVQAHVEDLPELCHSVKVIEVSAADRSALSDAWKSIIESHLSSGGEIPVGNQTGNTLWTTKKVKRVKPDFRLTPGPHVKLDVTLQELIDMVVKENQVVVFIKGSRSAPECGFSHKVLTILNDLKVNYESVNVLDEKHNYGIREEIKQYTQWPTIPQVFVKGEFVGGADILEEMATSGELIKILNEG